MNPKVCRYNKYGYCKFSEKCMFKHINEKCADKNCGVFDCDQFILKAVESVNIPNCAFNHQLYSDNKEIYDKISKMENKLKKSVHKSLENKFDKHFEAIKACSQKRPPGLNFVLVI